MAEDRPRPTHCIRCGGRRDELCNCFDIDVAALDKIQVLICDIDADGDARFSYPTGAQTDQRIASRGGA